jgi:lantibiotic modifying enzyme
MNTSGWSLTSRLISKHFGAIGDKVAMAIANFDPETATEADRDELASNLRETAQKLAQARISFDKEHADVTSLQTLIAQDTQAAATLTARLTAGTLSEAQVTLFLDELEANKGKLAGEQAEEDQAREFRDELQKIVDGMSQQLADFDKYAKAALQQLAQAEAQRDLQAVRLNQQSSIAALKGATGHTTALDALTRKAQDVSAQAAGDKIVADIGNKPQEQQAEIDAIRASIAQPNKETVAERLARLTGTLSA